MYRYLITVLVFFMGSGCVFAVSGKGQARSLDDKFFSNSEEYEKRFDYSGSSFVDYDIEYLNSLGSGGSSRSSVDEVFTAVLDWRTVTNNDIFRVFGGLLVLYVTYKLVTWAYGAYLLLSQNAYTKEKKTLPEDPRPHETRKVK